MHQVYDIAGMTIRSALPLHAARPSPAGVAADAEILLGDVPQALGSNARVCGDWQLDGVAALIDVPGAARFLVENGRRIVIAPAPRASPSAIERELLGPVTDLLLLQRGRFRLHGMRIEVVRHRVLILGRMRGALLDIAEQLDDERNNRDIEQRIVLPGIGDAPRVCFVRPLLPRSAVPEVVSMTPFSAFTWARKLVCSGLELTALDREGEFLHAASQFFGEAAPIELRWPMRALSALEKADVLERIAASSYVLSCSEGRP